MALTKKIPELTGYGSKDSSKLKKDLFEVSKNDGTYLIPSYPVDSSRKITQEELQDMLGYIPYEGQNYLVVRNNGSTQDNGFNLLNALTVAYTMTPNGFALDDFNRCTIILFPGTYDLNSSQLIIGSFVDIIGVGNKESIIITSTNSEGVIKISNTHNYKFRNLKVYSSGLGGSIVHNTGQTDSGVWESIVVFGYNTVGTTFAGNYSRLECQGFTLNGNITGNVLDSNFAGNSCGFTQDENILISGNIIRCTSTGASFGSSTHGNVSITGSIINCKSLNLSYGYSTYGSISVSGIIDNNIGTDNCFGSNSSFDELVDISGVISNCKGNSNSFGYSSNNAVHVSGEILHSYANGNSFGYSSNMALVAVSGRLYECHDKGVDSFGTTTSTGIINGCTFRNSIATHLGTIYNCEITNESGSIKSALIISEGARVQYSKIVQKESSRDSIKVISGANVKVSHCETNKDFNTISGDSFVNLISIPYNVIDSYLI